MPCFSTTPDMASAGRAIYCHTSTGKGSNPPTACLRTLFICSHLCVCVRVCETWFCLWDCEWKIKNGSRSERDRTQQWRQRCAAVQLAFLLVFMESVFRWDRWKRGMLKGVAATNSLWVGKYARTGAHLSQNRRHCTPLLLIFCLSASFSFVFLFQSLISGQSTSLFLSAALSFLLVALFFFPFFLCLQCLCPTSISLL